MTDGLDAIVVGSGPNGLAAAITLARAGLRVRMYEAAETIGGGLRTAELTEPGFRHDVCSTVQVMAQLSPFFSSIDLAALGVRFRSPEIAFAHPLDGDRAAALYPDLDVTAAALGPDAAAWRRAFAPLLDHGRGLWPDLLGPLRTWPRDPITLTRFGLPALRSADAFANARFATDEARALFAGAAAHAMRRLEAPGTAAFGLVLALSAHAANWPVVEGGSGALAEALARYLTGLGGEIVTSTPVGSLGQLPPARVVLLDLGVRPFLRLAGDRLPSLYRRRLNRFRYGAGVFKLDWALSEPVPWRAAAARRAGTVHVGGTLGEVAAAEAAVEAGRPSARPYVLCVQPTLMDPTRAPVGKHVLWAYCHVPAGSTVDMTASIETQIERFAPGFRDTVIARHARTADEYEQYNPNFVGGDINGGQASIAHVFAGPVGRLNPYETPLPGVYLCSSSTPPGGGVHGMSGFHAARRAIRRWFPDAVPG